MREYPHVFHEVPDRRSIRGPETSGAETGGKPAAVAGIGLSFGAFGGGTSGGRDSGKCNGERRSA